MINAIYRPIQRFIGALAVIAACAAGTASAQEAKPLPDMALGSPDAKVTIIEYASMSCPHCAAFHTDVLPQIKQKYIDSGQIRLVFREFPLNAPAFQAAILARCAGPERFFGFIDILFRQQHNWAAANDPLTEMAQIARLGGVSDDQFRACLADQSIANGLLQSRLTAEKEFNVSSTPSFVINGKTYVGLQDMAAIDAIVTPLLAGGAAPAAAAGPSSPAQPAATAPASPGSPVPPWAIAVVVFVIVVGAGWFFIRRRRAS